MNRVLREETRRTEPSGAPGSQSLLAGRQVEALKSRRHRFANQDSGPRSTLRVCLLGASLRTGNRGVSALCASLAKLIWEIQEDAAISLMIGERRGGVSDLKVDGVPRTLEVINYRQSPRAPLREQLAGILLAAGLYRVLPVRRVRQALARFFPWIRALVAADVVGEIRGGDSFSDIYGLWRFFLGSLPVIMARLVHRQVVLLPQTYGPFKSRISRWIARYVLRGASVIMSRDQSSFETIRELMGKSHAVRFCPDVAFALEAVMPETLVIEPALPLAGEDGLIGLNVNGLMYHGGYTRANQFGLKLDYKLFLNRLVSALLATSRGRVLMVPHTFAPPERAESDPGACLDLLRSLPSSLLDRVHLVNHPYDQNEIKGVIGLCDFFIGSRMHACVAALSQGIPTVGVAYSQKFQGVFDSVGSGDWIVDGRTMEVDQAVALTMRLFAKRSGFKEKLATALAAAQTQLRAEFESLIAGAGQL